MGYNVGLVIIYPFRGNTVHVIPWLEKYVNLYLKNNLQQALPPNAWPMGAIVFISRGGLGRWTFHFRTNGKHVHILTTRCPDQTTMNAPNDKYQQQINIITSF